MTPDERGLVERTLKLAEENNKILRSLRRAQTWSSIWGLIQIAVFVLPFVLGYFYLQPYLGSMSSLFKDAHSVIQMYNNGQLTPSTTPR